MKLDHFNQFNRNKKIFFPRDKIYHCHYCKIEMTNNRNDVKNPNLMTVDHKISRNDGGINSIDNLIACCQRCNNLKGSEYDYLGFKEIVFSVETRDILYEKVSKENTKRRSERKELRKKETIIKLALLFLILKGDTK